MSAQKPTVFRIISSHIRAFEQTSDLPTDVYTSGYPVSATSFWLVATKGAISYIHSDCFGVGTVVEVLCGRKLWYVFQRRRMVGNQQDSYIDEYMGDWAPGFIPDPEDWTSEVVLLEPGSALYTVLYLSCSMLTQRQLHASRHSPRSCYSGEFNCKRSPLLLHCNTIENCLGVGSHLYAWLRHHECFAH